MRLRAPFSRSAPHVRGSNNNEDWVLFHESCVLYCTVFWRRGVPVTIVVLTNVNLFNIIFCKLL